MSSLSTFLTLPLAVIVLVSNCSDEKAGDSPGNRGDDANQPGAPSTQSLEGQTAKTGSTARFTVLGEHLYAVSGGGLAAFDLTDVSDLKKTGFSAVNGDIETIYNDGNDLFIGSRNALYVYSVEDPDKPKRMSMLQHARACDPVVTRQNIAFVTLRSSVARCPGKGNQLKVVDVKDRENPVEIASKNMTAPRGLAINGDRLFVCDGSKGLVELNVSKPKKPKEVHLIEDEVCNDVISADELLFVTGDAGISQYDLTAATPERLSRIEVGAKPTQ